jgi:hypothetical protein
MRAEHCRVVAVAEVTPFDPDEVPQGVMPVAAVARRLGVPMVGEDEVDQLVSRDGSLDATRQRVLRRLGVGVQGVAGPGLGQ